MFGDSYSFRWEIVMEDQIAKMRIRRQSIRVEFVVVFAKEDVVWTGPVGIPNCVTELRQQMKISDRAHDVRGNLFPRRRRVDVVRGK